MAKDLVEHFERLAWARTEIDSLNKEVAEYLASEPYTIKHRTDPWSLIKTYRAVQASPPPRGAQIRSGTVVNEMRSTLDAMACTLALRNQATKVDDVYFPTAKSANGYTEPQVQRKIRRLSPADQATITGLKPYPGGNDLLYTLHSADILRKHQRLVLFANGVEGLEIGAGMLDSNQIVRIGLVGNDLATGVEIAKLRLGFHLNFKLELVVSFAEPDFIKGKPVVATLNDFADLVHSVLKLFD